MPGYIVWGVKVIDQHWCSVVHADNPEEAQKIAQSLADVGSPGIYYMAPSTPRHVITEPVEELSGA
jgi:hypothetical protein